MSWTLPLACPEASILELAEGKSAKCIGMADGPGRTEAVNA
jgi:hypothetical protein